MDASASGPLVRQAVVVAAEECGVAHLRLDRKKEVIYFLGMLRVPSMLRVMCVMSRGLVQVNDVKLDIIHVIHQNMIVVREVRRPYDDAARGQVVKYKLVADPSLLRQN